MHQKLIKENQNENSKKSIAESVKLRSQRSDIINKEKENINNKLFNHYFDYSNPGTMIKRLRDESDKKIKIWWN